MHCIVDLCLWLPPSHSPQRPQLAPLLGPFLSEAARRATALNRLKTGYGLHGCTPRKKPIPKFLINSDQHRERQVYHAQS